MYAGNDIVLNYAMCRYAGHRKCAAVRRTRIVVAEADDADTICLAAAGATRNAIIVDTIDEVVVHFNEITPHENTSHTLNEGNIRSASAPGNRCRRIGSAVCRKGITD